MNSIKRVSCAFFRSNRTTKETESKSSYIEQGNKVLSVQERKDHFRCIQKAWIALISKDERFTNEEDGKNREQLIREVKDCEDNIFENTDINAFAARTK